MATDDLSHVVGVVGIATDDLPHVVGIVGVSLAVEIPEVAELMVGTIHVVEAELTLLTPAGHTPHCRCEDRNGNVSGRHVCKRE